MVIQNWIGIHWTEEEELKIVWLKIFEDLLNVFDIDIDIDIDININIKIDIDIDNRQPFICLGDFGSSKGLNADLWMCGKWLSLINCANRDDIFGIDFEFRLKLKVNELSVFILKVSYTLYTFGPNWILSKAQNWSGDSNLIFAEIWITPRTWAQLARVRSVLHDASIVSFAQNWGSTKQRTNEPTNQRTNGPMDQWTNKPTRQFWASLKIETQQTVQSIWNSVSTRNHSVNDENNEELVFTQRIADDANSNCNLTVPVDSAKWCAARYSDF
jgi:hypothetical protein